MTCSWKDREREYVLCSLPLSLHLLIIHHHHFVLPFFFTIIPWPLPPVEAEAEVTRELNNTAVFLEDAFIAMEFSSSEGDVAPPA